MNKIELYHDNFQNYKRYGIPRAQLVIADIPYNVGDKAYGSNPMWYVGGDNKNGESKHAKSAFFNGDGEFNLNEYFHFCSKLLKKEPKERGKSPCMIIFCAFEQMTMLIDIAKKHGYMHYSADLLQELFGAGFESKYESLRCDDKLPKFNNGRKHDEDGKVIRGTGKMIFNWFSWERDGKDIPKIHPTQKPVNVLKRLIEIFTDENDVVIDPCAGSGSTLQAAHELGRKAYGFEVSTKFYKSAMDKMPCFKNNE